MKKFYIGIKAIVVNNKKALVLRKVRNGINVYDLPGGRIDKGELIQDALKRELKEEIGLTKFSNPQLINIFERQDYEKNGTYLMLVVYKIDANIFRIKLSDEHTNYEWISKKELNKISKNAKQINKGIVNALSLVL
jgi:mutator protein MutT